MTAHGLGRVQLAGNEADGGGQMVAARRAAAGGREAAGRGAASGRGSQQLVGIGTISSGWRRTRREEWKR